MNPLKEYLSDGANYQAKAVLHFLQGDGEIYELDVKVARWENCREQGYILSLVSSDYQHQINIAFFEHRNSDSICAVKWNQRSMNTLTIDTAKFGDVYKDKYDVSFSVNYGEIREMCDWLAESLKAFACEFNPEQNEA